MKHQLRVLVIGHRQDARNSGAKWGDCRHYDKPDLQFWWPSLGLGMLAGREFDVVCLTIEIGTELREWLAAHLTRRGRAGTIVVEGRLW